MEKAKLRSDLSLQGSASSPVLTMNFGRKELVLSRLMLTNLPQSHSFILTSALVTHFSEVEEDICVYMT